MRGLAQSSPPSINLYPEAVALSKAIALFIKDSDWNSYTLLYDDDLGEYIFMRSTSIRLMLILLVCQSPIYLVTALEVA